MKAIVNTKINTKIRGLIPLGSGLNPIHYENGTLMNITSAVGSTGVTSVESTDKKEGTGSYQVMFSNALADNYVDLMLPSNVLAGQLVGVWMYINYAEQLNVSNIKFELFNGIYKQSSLFTWGNAMSTTDYQGNQYGMFSGGWQYVKIMNESGNPINRIRVVVKSNLPVNNTIAQFKFDNIVTIQRKIKPVFIFNVDGCFVNADNYDGAASSVYDWFTELGLPYTITSTMPSVNFNRERIFAQVQSKIAELGCYSGEVSAITNAASYAEIMPLIDQLKTKKITDGYGNTKVVGAQFHKVTPDIKQAFNDSGTKVIKGGLGGWQAFAFQNVYGYVGNEILQVHPTQFGQNCKTSTEITNSKNDAKSFIDKVVSYGSVGILFAHDFAIVPADNVQTSTESWRYQMEYVKSLRDAGTCEVMLMSDFQRRLKTPLI